jgi:hypothetical protein
MTIDTQYKLAMQAHSLRCAIRETRNPRLAAALQRKAAQIGKELRCG